MGRNIAIGSGMILLTVLMHAIFMVVTIRWLNPAASGRPRMSTLQRFRVISSSVLLMFLANLVEIGLWATLYVALGAVAGAEPALYFSGVTFTTLGYGDMVLDPRWRLLGSFQAANGIIMFGWTTAVVVAVVQRVYAPGRD